MNNDELNKSANPSQSTTANLNLQTDSQITNDNEWYQLSGRIGRLRYLSYQLSAFITVCALAAGIILVFLLIGIALSLTFPKILLSIDFPQVIKGLIIVLLFPYAFYAAIVYSKRRLHDLNKTGWLLILAFIPLVNFIFTLYLVFAPGNPSVNQYGYPPRPNRRIHYFGAFTFIALICIGGIFATIYMVNNDLKSYYKGTPQGQLGLI